MSNEPAASAYLLFAAVAARSNVSVCAPPCWSDTLLNTVGARSLFGSQLIIVHVISATSAAASSRMRHLTESYARLAALYGHRDWSLAHLPLAGTPVAPLLLLAAYVWLVFVGAPRFMRDRPAYGMRWFMLGYNALQVAMNAFMTLWVSMARNGGEELPTYDQTFQMH